MKKRNKGGTVSPKKKRLTDNEKAVLRQFLTHPDPKFPNSSSWMSVYDVMRDLNRAGIKREREKGIPVTWDDHFTQVSCSILTGLVLGQKLDLMEQTQDYDSVLVDEETQKFDTVPRPHYRVTNIRLANAILRRGGYLFNSDGSTD
jgi:hypothetical protein